MLHGFKSKLACEWTASKMRVDPISWRFAWGPCLAPVPTRLLPKRGAALRPSRTILCSIGVGQGVAAGAGQGCRGGGVASRRVSWAGAWSARVGINHILSHHVP